MNINSYVYGNFDPKRKIVELTFIKIPLYKLNHIYSIEEVDLNEDFMHQFKKEYDVEERESIFEQLNWGVKNSDYDFNSLVDTDRFSNKEIYQYICNLYEFMKENNR